MSVSKWELVACQNSSGPQWWFPCFDKGDGWMPTVEAFFDTEQECQDFIDEILKDVRP